jgi:Ser/Thr protein kinase RdoA (MazF antagonist)
VSCRRTIALSYEQSNYVAVYRRKGPLVGRILGAINSNCKASTTEGDRQNKSFLRRAPNTLKVLRPTERPQRNAAITGQLRRLTETNGQVVEQYEQLIYSLLTF